jgi:hypothetical protein
MEMAQQFMKKYAAPMWTGLSWQFSEKPITEILHNNDVECYFGKIKKELDDAAPEIQKRPVRGSRFIRQHCTSIESKLRRYDLGISKMRVARITPYRKRNVSPETPSIAITTPSRKKKRSDSEFGCDPYEVEEQWMIKRKPSPQTCFKNTILNFRFYKYLLNFPFESSHIETSGAGHCSQASCKIPGRTLASCDGGLTEMEAYIEIKKTKNQI